MSETPKFNPTEDPQPENEHFQDTDPTHETLQRINEGFQLLTELSNNTHYRRDQDIALDPGAPDPEFIQLSLDTKGTLDKRGVKEVEESAIHVNFPTGIGPTQKGAFSEISPTLILRKNKNGVIAQFVLPLDVSPREFFDPLFAMNLADDTRNVFKKAAESLSNDGIYDMVTPMHPLYLTEEEYHELWNTLEGRFDAESPTHVSLSWQKQESDEDFLAPPSADATHIAVEALRQGPTFNVQSAHVIEPSRYSYSQQEDENGVMTYVFRDEKQDEEALQLPYDEEGEDEDSDIIYDLQSAEEHEREKLTQERAERVLQTLEELVANVSE